MKPKFLIFLWSLLLVIGVCAETRSYLRMEAKIAGKASYSDAINSKAKTQTRNLNIKITNTSDNAVGDTEVRWAIYGHSMKDGNLVVIKESNEKIVVPANDAIVVTTPEIQVTGNREYSVPSKKSGKGKGGKGRKRKTTFKKVPASGEDYYGYAVEILTNGKLVASYYSKPSIEKDMRPDD